MNPWHDISYGKKVPSIVRTVIEIPKGSHMKYELDKETGMIILDRVSHTTNVYPGDYGFVPRTYWEDDDPLDILVITEHPVVPGTLADVRVVGVLRMNDSGESDDKIVGVYAEDPRYDEVEDITDIPEHRIKEIKHFFETYKDLQNKKVVIDGIDGVEAARKTVQKGIKLYEEKF